MKCSTPTILLALLLSGCGSNDQRLVDMAKDHEKRQAEQSQQMATLQHEVAEGARKLVEEDAKAREALTQMQDKLRGDQSEIGKQRDALEADRREIAAQRNRDPIVAASILQAALWLACLLPLILAAYVIYATRSTASSDDAIVAEFLVTDIAAEHPLLLAPPSPEPLKLPNPETAETASAA